MTKYPKGSEWRIWDLHIHTPGTAKNDQYGNDEAVWEAYITKLEENTDVAVLGITDYFSIENYLFLKQKQADGSLQGPLRRGGGMWRTKCGKSHVYLLTSSAAKLMTKAKSLLDIGYYRLGFFSCI